MILCKVYYLNLILLHHALEAKYWMILSNILCTLILNFLKFIFKIHQLGTGRSKIHKLGTVRSKIHQLGTGQSKIHKLGTGRFKSLSVF